MQQNLGANLVKPSPDVAGLATESDGLNALNTTADPTSLLEIRANTDVHALIASSSPEVWGGWQNVSGAQCLRAEVDGFVITVDRNNTSTFMGIQTYESKAMIYDTTTASHRTFGHAEAEQMAQAVFDKNPPGLSRVNHDTEVGLEARVRGYVEEKIANSSPGDWGATHHIYSSLPRLGKD